MALQSKVGFSDRDVPGCHLWIDEEEGGERMPNSADKNASGIFNHTVKKKEKKEK